MRKRIFSVALVALLGFSSHSAFAADECKQASESCSDCSAECCYDFECDTMGNCACDAA